MVVDPSSVFTAVTAAELGVTTSVAAVLLLVFGSGVVLPAVVTIWTVPALVGVNVVVQVIAPLTGNGLGAGAGLQIVVAPAGVPPGKPTTRRYSDQEKSQAVRLVRQLRRELGTDHGTVGRVARQLGYKSVKYLTRITVVDSLTHVGDGRGSAQPSYGYSWFAGI